MMVTCVLTLYNSITLIVAFCIRYLNINILVNLHGKHDTKISRYLFFVSSVSRI